MLLIVILLSMSLAAIVCWRWVPGYLVCAFVMLCTGAIASIWQVHHALEHRVPSSMIGKDVRVRIKLHSIVDERPVRQVIVADTVSLVNPLAFEVQPRRWRINWYGLAQKLDGSPIELNVGDEWSMTLRLRGLHGNGNPGGFDVSAWYLRTGVDAVAYVRNEPAPVLERVGVEPSIVAWRTDLAKRVIALRPDNRFSAVVVALTLGFRDGVSDEFQELLIRTGTAHLLAISGLHIGLVSAAAYLLFKGVWVLFPGTLALRFSRSTFAGIAAVMFALMYAALAGFSPPTQRAVGMCAVAFVVLTTRRSVSPWLPFSLALSFVVLTDVLRLLSPGVWLSFGTVALIVLLHRPTQPVGGHMDVEGHAARGAFDKTRVSLLSAWRMHVVLGVCLLPITGWFFSTGSIVSPLANLLAVPLVSLVVVPLSLMVVVLTIVLPESTWLASHCLYLVTVCIEGLEYWLKLCANLPVSGVAVTVPNVFILLTALAGVLCLCGPAGLGLRRFCVPLCTPILVWSLGFRTVQGMEVHVLDVGQGHASLVLTEHHAVLIDTGDRIGGGRSHWDATVLPALHRLGRRDLTHVVISHSDADHAAGAEALAAAFPDAHFWMGGVSVIDQGASLPIHVERCRAGQRWQLDEVEFSFLHPAKHDVESELIGLDVADNDESCVLLVQYGQSTVLFPGDIERRGEQRLLRRLGMNEVLDKQSLANENGGSKRLSRSSLQAEQGPVSGWHQSLSLLVAPHHGSRSSSSEEFVAVWRPEHVVFPAGYRNRSGFPHDEVLMRYKIGGSELYVTGQDGAVQFYFGPDGLDRPPNRYWVKHRRLWHMRK